MIWVIESQWEQRQTLKRREGIRESYNFTGIKYRVIRSVWIFNQNPELADFRGPMRSDFVYNILNVPEDVVWTRNIRKIWGSWLSSVQGCWIWRERASWIRVVQATWVGRKSRTKSWGLNSCCSVSMYLGKLSLYYKWILCPLSPFGKDERGVSRTNWSFSALGRTATTHSDLLHNVVVQPPT